MKEIKKKISSNYRVEDMDILLNQDGILKRYYPLITYKRILIENLLKRGLLTKDDCKSLTDSELLQVGLPDQDMAQLFRSFLTLYDYKGKGIKDIPNIEAKSDAIVDALLELMHLPGVKSIRAEVYYQCGFKSLHDFTLFSAEQMKDIITDTITRELLPYSPPALKELRTQIAVAKVFTTYETNKEESDLVCGDVANVSWSVPCHKRI